MVRLFLKMFGMIAGLTLVVLAGVEGPSRVMSHGRSAARDVANGIEDNLVPLRWIVAAAEEECEATRRDLAVQRVAGERLARDRAAAVRDAATCEARVVKLTGAVADADKLLADGPADGSSTGGTGRTANGQYRADLTATRRQVAQALAAAKTAAERNSALVKSLDDGIVANGRSISDLARTEAAQRQKLAQLRRDYEVAEARRRAAEAQVASLDRTRHAATGDSAEAALQRRVDQATEAAVAAEIEASASGAADAQNAGADDGYPISLDSLHAATTERQAASTR